MYLVPTLFLFLCFCFNSRLPYAYILLFRFSSTVFGVGDERTTTDGGSGGPSGGGKGDHQSQDDGDVGESAKRLRLELLAEAQEEAAAQSSYRILDQEIDAFLAMRTRDQGALDFWRTHSNTFPALSAMARCYLCISPGSVPVECLFSSCSSAQWQTIITCFFKV